MGKQRELTAVEKFYIENNRGDSNSKIAKCMTGIGPATVKKYRDSLPDERETTPDSSATEENLNKRDCKTETRKERMDRLSGEPAAGNFMGKRDGAVVMTQQASEITDARKVIRGVKMSGDEYEKINNNKIHRPNG